jgi:uncharacterized membrane protein (UPF0127 family)
MKNKIVKNLSSNTILNAKDANSFFTKLLGLVFQKEIANDSCLILSERSESIINTSIHMLFMRFDITVVWLSKSLVVIDKKIAKKWHLAYFPIKPAEYVLELHTSQYKNFSIGDQLQIYENIA